jgi:uncharacterized protein (TIGR02147 family)
MNLVLFNYRNYKKYVTDAIEALPRGGRGARAALSELMKVQSAYLSRVLNGDADLSLEQADLANRFFAHSEEESRFFLFMVEQNRAGTKTLRDHFDREMRRILDTRERVQMESGVQAKEMLTLEDQNEYYSTWHYSAVHVALSIPSLRTKSALSQELGISLKRVAEILEFLVRTRLARETGGKYEIGKVWIHLNPRSPLACRHHMNWRLKATSSSGRMSREDFHYTQVVTLSREDAQKITNLIAEAVEGCNQIIKPSPEEETRCLAMDFFRVNSAD